MGSDEEEFYDSIDDIEFGECKVLCHDKHRNEDSELGAFDSKKRKELHSPLNNRKIGKIENNSFKSDSKSCTVTTAKKSRLNGRMPPISLSNQKKNRSYLNMFYARYGQSVKLGTMDSNRATCPEVPPRTNLCSSLRRGASSSHLSIPWGANFLLGLRSSSTHITSRDRPKRDTSKSKLMPKRVKCANLRGPNIAPEKLELLRRGQDYGNAASERNRIQLPGNKVVRQLRQENDDCNLF